MGFIRHEGRSARWTAWLAVLLLVSVLASLAWEGGAEGVVAEDFILLSASGAERLSWPGRAASSLTPGEPFAVETTVALPASLRGQPLGVVLPFHGAPAELSVNGERAPPLGSVAAAYRHAGPLAYRVPEAARGASSLTLRFELRYGWSGAAWFGLPPRVTSLRQAERLAARFRIMGPGLASLAAGALSTIGFLCGVIFLRDRRHKPMGWFALEAISATAYSVFCTGWTADLLGPLEIPLMATLLSTAIVGSVWFAHTKLRLGAPRRWLWLVVPAVALSFAPGGAGFGLQRGPAPAVVLVVFAGIAYQVSLMLRVREVPSLRGEATAYLGCWLALGATAWTDFAYWLGVPLHTTGIPLAPIGLTLFALIQATTLSQGFLAYAATTDALNERLAAQLAALAEREREVTRLNAELSRQVAARTDELAAALVRLATAAREEVRLAPGDVVDGRYVVQRRIGSGGAGGVYAVNRREDDQPLALKILLGTPDMINVARFAREAQLLASIRHPNVVQVVDASVAEAGYLYVVMELVDGRPLHELRAERADTGFCLDVLAGVLAGLEAIHAAGVVHRDLKPANVLVAAAAGPSRAEGEAAGHTAERIVKIADFGVSRAARLGELASLPRTGVAAPRRSEGAPAAEGAETDSAPLTLVGEVMGTPAYLAPEALADATQATEASDVYSFGVLAHELLAGSAPAPAPEVALAQALGHGPPRQPLAELRPDLPLSLTSALDRALAREPGERPTAAALRALVVQARAERVNTSEARSALQR